MFGTEASRCTRQSASQPTTQFQQHFGPNQITASVIHWMLHGDSCDLRPPLFNLQLHFKNENHEITGRFQHDFSNGGDLSHSKNALNQSSIGMPWCTQIRCDTREGAVNKILRVVIRSCEDGCNLSSPVQYNNRVRSRDAPKGRCNRKDLAS